MLLRVYFLVLFLSAVPRDSYISRVLAINVLELEEHKIKFLSQSHTTDKLC